MDPLTDLCYVKSVGPKRAELFRKLGLVCVRDLIHHFPRRYLDLTQPIPVRDLPYQQPAAVRARLLTPPRQVFTRGKATLYKGVAGDETGQFDLVFFNNPYAAKLLKMGQYYRFYGRVGGNLVHRELVNPLILPDSPCILPVYPTTDKLPQAAIRTAVTNALASVQDDGEVISPELRRQWNLCDRDYALQQIHRPDSLSSLERARRRLAFEELLLFALALADIKRRERTPSDMTLSPVDMTPFYDALGFTLTAAQQRVIDECLADYATPYCQNRLIQGDVGSGKTACACAVIYYMVKNGYQTAMMAPTEVLATQHYDTLSTLFEPLGVRCALLTGSTPTAKRRQLLEQLKQGQMDVLIGTHALITEDVAFADLGLVVTDEQHRFGVAQREALSKKGRRPHVLVMSATPIPRTLALILYAELDVSQVDQLPQGRKPIATYAVTQELRERLYGFVKKHVHQGRQAYVICARAEDDPTSELASVKQLCRQLQSGYLAGLRCEYVYGKMPTKKKQAVLQAFYEGKVDVLVSTTVVEVGVNVPNATVMVIENAERFGLSQLHQLRGRVGRGSEQSYCILVSQSAHENERLQVMTQTNDGFAISKRDLELRGPGEFFGTRQSGLTRFRIADLLGDMQTLIQARDAAGQILSTDPQLCAPQHRRLRQAVQELVNRYATNL